MIAKAPSLWMLAAPGFRAEASSSAIQFVNELIGWSWNASCTAPVPETTEQLGKCSVAGFDWSNDKLPSH